jgi:hypothetical protein
MSRPAHVARDTDDRARARTDAHVFREGDSTPDLLTRVECPPQALRAAKADAFSRNPHGIGAPPAYFLNNRSKAARGS